MKNNVISLALACLLSIFNTEVLAKNIVVFGDSLSAAYGMDVEKGWVHLLSEALQGKHIVQNASISGETSAGGLARMPLTLAELKPDLLLLELGANDGLQGLPIKKMRANLERMIQLNLSAGVEVAIIGVSLPATYGPRYINEFRSSYIELAQQYKLPFVDFYREEFIAKEGNIQADGLHPTEKTQAIIKNWVLTFLNKEKFLD